ncbi:MAG: S8 family serine peptidase [Saprospiraceae bacterium]
MKANFNLVLLTIGIACFTLQSCNQDGKDAWQAPLLTPASGSIPDQYIIQIKPVIMTDFKSNTVPNSREKSALLAQEKLSFFKSKLTDILQDCDIPVSAVSAYYSEIFYGIAATLNKTQLNRLIHHSSVEMIESDMEVHLPDITIDPGPTGMRAQTTPCGITNAAGPMDGSGSSKWIWIVDTGIDLDHPDLNVETNPAYAKSFASGQNNPDDCHGHGTHCAGIAAAKNNSIGVVGVSAGARVVPVRVLNCQGSGQTSWILNGLNHVAANDEPGDVVNMSLGGYWGTNCSSQSSYVTALTNLSNAGTRVAVAAGNSSDNAAYYTPACINASNIHTIASMTCAKAWSSFSNYGVPPVDWIATGSSVYSTYKKGGYATLSGTSMASPHVAGIMHYLQSAPVQNGSVSNGGTSYKIASIQ